MTFGEMLEIEPQGLPLLIHSLSSKGLIKLLTTDPVHITIKDQHPAISWIIVKRL